MKKVFLIVTVDTEEDNWGLKIPDLGLKNIDQVPKLQRVFDSFDIRPIYLCSTPVVEGPRSSKILEGIFESGRCDIGTHLHPWNSPPVVESLSDGRYSQLANLPEDLIEAKISELTEKIKNRFGKKPIIFRAGRWGFSEKVGWILAKLGYKIDTSVTPFTDWARYDEGSDFSEYPPEPYFISTDGSQDRSGHESGIIEIPVSIGFNRLPFPLWAYIYDAIQATFLTKLRLIGILHKTGILKKVWLSPEFNNATEMLRLSKLMISAGMNVLHFTFHSPSLVPGLGPFVETEQYLERFYKNIENFLSKLNSIGEVISLSSGELLHLVEEGKITLNSRA